MSQILFVYGEYLYYINHSALALKKHNIIGFNMKNQVPQIIIEDHSRDHIINFTIKMNINSIVVIEKYNKFLTEMRIIG